jgi:hypothetical protein
MLSKSMLQRRGSNYLWRIPSQLMTKTSFNLLPEWLPSRSDGTDPGTCGCLFWLQSSLPS